MAVPIIPTDLTADEQRVMLALDDEREYWLHSRQIHEHIGRAIHEAKIDRILDAMRGLRIAKQDDDGRWSITPEGIALVADIRQEVTL